MLGEVTEAGHVCFPRQTQSGRLAFVCLFPGVNQAVTGDNLFGFIPIRNIFKHNKTYIRCIPFKFNPLPHIPWWVASPQNKATYNHYKFLFATLAPIIVSVRWSVLCLLVSGCFVTDKLVGCCDETSKPSASGKAIRKSVTCPVNNAACLSIASCWL